MNSCDIYFVATTIICSLSTLTCCVWDVIVLCFHNPFSVVLDIEYGVVFGKSVTCAPGMYWCVSRTVSCVCRYVPPYS